MAHNRTAIRDALVALVEPALATATLHAERRQRIDSAMRPLVILVLGTDGLEPTQRSMGSPYTVEHSQNCTFEIHTEAADGKAAAEAIDQIELEIEGAIASDLHLGGLVELMSLTGSELEMLTDQDRVIAVRTVEYLAVWRSEFGSPDTPEN